MKKDGFTLVELLVAVGVLALLVGISLVAFRGSQAAARDAQRRTELEEIRTALEVYRTDNGSYPGTSGNAEVAGVLHNLLVTPGYMASIPLDPRHTANRYYYYTGDSGVTYGVCARLELDTVQDDTCGVARPCGSAGVCSYGLTNP
jgi:general secretion pathway protein G